MTAQREVDPKYTDYMIPLLEVLRELDGSGNRAQILSLIAKKLNLSEDYLSRRQKTGELVYKNRTDWAKYYLAKAGYINTSKSGIWELTPKGFKEVFDYKKILEIVKEVKKLVKLEGQPPEAGIGILNGTADLQHEAVAPSDDPLSPLRQQLAKMILGTSPTGFERLCTRLLKEYSFEEVQLTSVTKDGGLDGQGRLYINPLYSIKVVFQCKRYADKIVGVETVHQLAGAISSAGVAIDKGILFTTSGFSSYAQQAAEKTNPPIALVDMEKLLDMLIEKQLGYETTSARVVTESWFEPFLE